MPDSNLSPDLLDALAEELPRGPLARSVMLLAERLRGGASIDEALADMSEVATETREVLAVGLRSGRLDLFLQDLAEARAASRDLRRRLIAAVTYPAIVLAVFGGVLAIFLVWVVPMFGEIFEDFQLDLPAMTRILIDISAAMTIILPVAGGIVLLTTLALVLVRRSPARWVLDRLMFAVPLLGELWSWAGIAEFTRFVGAAIRAGAPLPDALHLAGSSLHDRNLGRVIGETADDVAGGRPLAECLVERAEFPRSISSLAAWGEKSGTLLESLDIAAEMSESRGEMHVRFLVSIVPPAIFLFVVTLAGFLLVALFMPLVKLISSLT